MKTLRTIALIGLGMALGVVLLLGAGSVWAQGPQGREPGTMHGQGMMRGHRDMAAMHAQMHVGEAMPEGCQQMMNGPAMMGPMMQMMHRGRMMSLEEAQRWMEERDVPADVQAQGLAHMAEHHSQSVPAPEQ
jgi:hypothetical protein